MGTTHVKLLIPWITAIADFEQRWRQTKEKLWKYHNKSTWWHNFKAQICDDTQMRFGENIVYLFCSRWWALRGKYVPLFLCTHNYVLPIGIVQLISNNLRSMDHHGRNLCSYVLVNFTIINTLAKTNAST